MIYLKHNTEAQSLYIPKDGESPSGRLTFRAESTVDLTGFSAEVLDIHTSDLFFRIAVRLPEDASMGEYDYTLQEGQRILSTGVLVVGDLQPMQQYNNIITYEQYRQ